MLIYYDDFSDKRAQKAQENRSDTFGLDAKLPGKDFFFASCGFSRLVCLLVFCSDEVND